MRRLLFLLGLLAVSGFFARAEVDDATMREAAQKFLKAVVGDLLQNPQTAVLFPEAKVEEAALRPHERGTLGPGWIGQWGYEHNVHWVQAPSGMQVGSLPKFDCGPGMVFHLFVTLDHGGDMVSRVENYPILRKPDLMVAFDLQSGGEPTDLQRQIEAVIQAHLPAFRQAVSAGQAGG